MLSGLHQRSRLGKLQSVIYRESIGMLSAYQLFVKYGLVAGGIVVGGLNYAYRVYCPTRFKENLQLKSPTGTPVEINEKLMQTINSALSDADLKIDKKLKASFFISKQDMPCAAGVLGLKGAAIGLPLQFTFESLTDVPQGFINVTHLNTVKQDSKSTGKLLESLILSENVKQFAILDKLYFTDTNRALFQSLAIPFNFMVAWTIYEILLTTYKDFATKARIHHLIVFLMTSIFAAVNFMLLDNFIKVHYETKCLKKAASAGQQYLDSGIEFYKKILKRNKMYRKLLGKDGEKLYTEDGDVITFVPEITLTNKLLYLEKLKEESASQNKSN